jgi:hypothetical protein
MPKKLMPVAERRHGTAGQRDWLLQLVARTELAGYGAWCPGSERGADVGR